MIVDSYYLIDAYTHQSVIESLNMVTFPIICCLCSSRITFRYEILDNNWTTFSMNGYTEDLNVDLRNNIGYTYYLSNTFYSYNLTDKRTADQVKVLHGSASIVSINFICIFVLLSFLIIF